MRGRSIVFVLAGLALAACGKFNAPEPARTPPPPAPPIPLSTVSATLTVPMGELIRAVNEKTANQLARAKDQPANCGIAKCKLDLLATRTGPITGGTEDGRITLSLPFHIDADVKLKALFRIKAHASTDGVARAATTLGIGPDWQLVTHTQGDVQMSNAEVNLGPLKATLTDLWNHNDRHLSDPLFQALDRRLPEQLKIRPAIQKLWARAFEPIRVGKRPEAWLLLSPERALVGEPIVSGNQVTLSVGVEGQARVVLGARPAPPEVIPPLPAPGRLGAPSNRFSFVVPVTLPYDEAARLALARLQKKPPRIKGANIKFDRLEILPSGQDVIVSTHFCVGESWDPFGWFTSCGTGYLRGVPKFDSANGTIRVTNMHYDVATEGAILAAMKFLAGDELGRALEKNLVFSVATDLDKLDDEVRAALAKPQGKGIQIRGTIDRFGTPTLTWTDTGFLAEFPAEGTVETGLDFENLER
ncbi:MAG TPA: DUF4403 family protein [Rhizomicrobium sp.]|nr:DUF4403 family protein [Rhizomicrobium sp.]